MVTFPVRTFYPRQQGYRRLQAAVAAHFRVHHGAHPTPRPDEFRCLADPTEPAPGHACIGLCRGGRGPLFSEHYLDEPVAESFRVCPTQVVELGQFCSFAPGAGLALMARTLASLAASSDWLALMTATDRVRRLLATISVDFHDLGPAQPTRVRDRAVEWGTYYVNQPRVLVIELRERLATLKSFPWLPPAARCAESKPSLRVLS
jgi:hypothetical protein